MLIRAQGIDHLFYLLLTLLCGGIALFFWLFQCLFWTPTWRCTRCGVVCRGPVDNSARVLGYILLAIVVVPTVAVLGVLFVGVVVSPQRESPARHREPDPWRPPVEPAPPAPVARRPDPRPEWRRSPPTTAAREPDPAPRSVAVPTPLEPSRPPEPQVARGESKPAPGADPFAPRVVPAEAKPAPPKTVVLNAAGRMLTVGDSPGSLLELGRLAVADDRAGIQNMLRAGRLIEVRGPVEVVKLNTAGGYAYFRFADGPHEGKTGVLRTTDFK